MSQIKTIKRREALLSAMAVFTGTTRASTTRTSQKTTLPALPTIPIGASRELADEIRRSYLSDLTCLAESVEMAIMTFRACPDWVSSGEMPEQLRAILREDTGEAFSRELSNLAPLKPGYPSRLIDEAKANLVSRRERKRRDAEAGALVEAESAAREAAADARDAERERLCAGKLIPQNELTAVLLAKAMVDSAQERFGKRLEDGWTIEPGPLSLGPGPTFEIIDDTERDICA